MSNIFPNLSRIIHVAFSLWTASRAAIFGEDAATTLMLNAIWYFQQLVRLTICYMIHTCHCLYLLVQLKHCSVTFLDSYSSQMGNISALLWYSSSFLATSSLIILVFVANTELGSILLL